MGKGVKAYKTPCRGQWPLQNSGKQKATPKDDLCTFYVWRPDRDSNLRDMRIVAYCNTLFILVMCPAAPAASSLANVFEQQAGPLSVMMPVSAPLTPCLAPRPHNEGDRAAGGFVRQDQTEADPRRVKA